MFGLVMFVKSKKTYALFFLSTSPSAHSSFLLRCTHELERRDVQGLALFRSLTHFAAT
jgi:hypothetical protein